MATFKDQDQRVVVEMSQAEFAALSDFIDSETEGTAVSTEAMWAQLSELIDAAEMRRAEERFGARSADTWRRDA